MLNLRGKYPFLSPRSLRGLGKAARNIWKKLKEIVEKDATVDRFQDFSIVPELFEDMVLVVVFVDQEITISYEQRH